ncbi:DeoR/GlpR family DNA-binding transcription regulator [Amphibacillus sp. Q70]|uniref:DeoR/GlpR family DNA-binding transcription regulator n=1 Tax=Amphibacillus sp. Q70 TaxID=3453416 RepID=UPI003F826D5B
MKKERQNEILKILREKKVCAVSDLCNLIYASPATIRRDIKDLKEKGLIRSFYGGVSIIEKNRKSLFEERKAASGDKKKVIADLAIQLIKDDMLLSMDPSTTCLTLGEKLGSFKNIQVLSNGLETVRTLHNILQSPLYLTGGRLNPQTISIVGDIAHEQIQNYYTDIFFCSCRTLTELGTFEASENEAQVKRHFSKNTAKTVLLCDDSKFNKALPHASLKFDQIDYIITNEPLPQNIQDQIKSNNPSLITISPNEKI